MLGREHGQQELRCAGWLLPLQVWVLFATGFGFEQGSGLGVRGLGLTVRDAEALSWAALAV